MQTPIAISEVLDLYQCNCAGLYGAVVATQDGLVLGATTSFGGDTPAATAASLWLHLQEDLSMIQTVAVSEALLWVDHGVWYLGRLENRHLLLAYTKSPTGLAH
ncbi:hypothetical protein [Diaphorobacter aerolatus]|uniref:Roadblock/LC7 domain-containing protein n=1 Tax=Diaphorobacter aerolatus TaxID=1288495 RepID=A0A7H0GM02_9BURK|nr:hypothetical protein [Diaphorobacter aerolatus]QNP49318.1 hypothetical protein H9K75_04440 [Diaphorobacter aerolatus]